MRNKIKKYITVDTIPYVIILVLFAIIHMKMNTNFGDDVVLRNTDDNIFGDLIQNYRTWGSPGLLFLLNRLFPRIPEIYFKVCDILVIVLAQYSISKIVDDKNAKYTKFIVVLLIVLYPFKQMSTAGWIATTTTYSFPLAFGLYSLVYLKSILDNKEINNLNYILFWISLVLGAGGLQFSLIIFGIYATFNIRFIMKRKIYKFSILQNITALLFVIYHTTSPGNANRSIQETITWFPDFNMISTINKIKLGFTSSIGNLVSGPNIFFLCFSFLLVIGVYCKYKNVLYRAISLIPLIAEVMFGVFSNVFANSFNELKSLMNNGSYDFIQINIYNFEQKINYLSIIIGFAILGAIITSIYLIFENTLKMIIVEIIFLAGFFSRMIMSFSPTIYASCSRTFIYFYFAMIVCGALIYNNISENIEEEKQKNILFYIGIIALVNYLQLLINI